MASINELYAENDSDDKSISMDDPEDIRDGNYVHPNINARYSRFKIRFGIRQVHSKWKGAEISSKMMGKGLHSVFKAIVKELNNSLPDLAESGSEVSHFIPEPRNFAEVTKSPAEVKKAWLKATVN